MKKRTTFDRWYPPQRGGLADYEVWNAHKQAFDLIYDQRDRVAALHVDIGKQAAAMAGGQKAMQSRINGLWVKGVPPVDGQALVYVGANGDIEWRTLPPIPPVPNPPGPNMLIAGGGVVWTGGLNFTVSAASYIIAGIVYSSPQTNLTLTAADPTNPRIDLIIVDNTGTVSFITGTPAPNPTPPTFDLSTQFELTFVLIPAASPTPSITSIDVYLENTEWTTAATANINPASTNNPYQGTKDIEATAAVTGNNITLTKPSGTVDLSQYTSLSFYIRNKANWPSPKSLSIFWLNGTTPVGNAIGFKNGVYNFDQTNVSGYQQIVIPLTAFATLSNLVNVLKIQVAGGGGSIGWYIDNIRLQANAGGGGGGTGGSGTVTSVGMTVPAEFAVAGVPITNAGTIAITKANESANTVWAGPTSGGAAQPTFRTLVPADIPVIVIGFIMNTGATGTNVGPSLCAPRAGSVTKCKITTHTSDATTDLTIKIKQNGVDVFSVDPTVVHATAGGTVSTFTTLTSSPLSVAADDVFTIDITSGTSSWVFTAQLE